MHTRVRILAVLSAIALLTTACGGDSGQDDQPETSTTATQQSDGSSADSIVQATDEPDPIDGGDIAEIDPGNMPAAGEVVFEVDGQTFSFNADDMDYFICDISDDWINVRSESETQDIGVQIDVPAGLGNATLIPEGSALRYDSFFGPATTGGGTAANPHVLYEGRFDASALDDPTDIADAGFGRVSVTCP